MRFSEKTPDGIARITVSVEFLAVVEAKDGPKTESEAALLANDAAKAAVIAYLPAREPPPETTAASAPAPTEETP